MRRAIAAAAVVAVTGLPVVAASASGSAGSSAAPLIGAGRATAATVPLITGGQVLVTTAGGQRSFLLRGAAGLGAAVTYQDAAGDRFIVPAAAAPYVGRQLSPSLFDVSALARDGIYGAARIPVALRFAPGVRVTAPPGVTLTSTSGQVVRGYVTAASGRRLGAALARQDGADTVGGHLAAAGRLFGGLAAMTLAAPGAPPAPVTPDYPLHILALKATDETGKPANNAFVVLVNTDDARRETLDPVPVNNGVARLAVPAGDYSLIAIFTSFNAQGVATASHTVVRNDFRVPATSRTTTVAVAERTATSLITVSVPRPATAQQMEILFDRASTAGTGVQTGLLDWHAVGPDYVSPGPAPRVGRLHYLVRWSGGRPSHGYWYDTAFAASGVPADEHFVVRPSQVATVHEHFSADPASPTKLGEWSDDPYDPALAFPGGHNPGVAPLVDFYSPVVVRMPGNLTVYVGTASGDPWVQTDTTPNSTFLFADPRTFLPGYSYSVDWAHGPLAPTLGQHTGPWVCQACTAGRTLSLRFSVAGDSDPGHFVALAGDLITASSQAHFTLYRGGTKLLSNTGAGGAVVPNIPAGPGTYRAVLEVNLAKVPGVSQSTHTLTDLTVRYTPGAGAPLPAGDTCAGQSTSSPCRVLPALTLGYQLATNSGNTSTSPTQVLHLQVGHVSYNGAGSHAPITSAAVRVSFDGGKTWQQASLTGSAGSYTATWPNPASARGTSPDIKVTAADAAGGSITQTITNAYTIATTSQHRSSR